MTYLTNDGPLNCAMVSFKPHNVCNYSCSYCHPGSNGGDQRWPEDSALHTAFIKALEEKNGHVFVEILGGEPTLWPGLLDFSNSIKSDRVVVNLSTNGSRTLRYWNDFPAGQFIVNLTCHLEQADVNHLYEVARLLKDRVQVLVTFLVTPTNFDTAKSLLDKFNALNVEVHFKPTRTSVAGSEFFLYSPAQDKFIKTYRQDRSKIKFQDWYGKLYPVNVFIDGVKKNWNHMVLDQENVFIGWECSAGLNRFVVEANGDIFRCYNRVGGSIGNIFTGYTLPKAPVICDFLNPCHCKFDAIVDKVRN